MAVEFPPPQKVASPTLPPTADAAWTPPAPTNAAGHIPTAPPMNMAPVAPAVAQQSKKPWWIVAAVVAIIAVGLGAVFALRGNSPDTPVADSPSPTLAAAPADQPDSGAASDADAALDGGAGGAEDIAGGQAFSLQSAVAQATEATVVEFDMTMDVGGIASVEMTGGIDTAAQLTTMRMDLGAMTGLAPGDGALVVILDGANEVMYMDASAFGDALPTEANWIALDFETLAAQSGQSVDDFTDSFATNPLDAAQLFDDVDPANIVELGDEDIDGEPTRRFEVTIDFAAAIEANPQLQQQLDNDAQLGQIPEELIYNVWVTEDNQLRRMSFDMDIAGQQIAMVMNMREIGGSLDVAIPSADDVMDLGELLGS